MSEKDIEFDENNNIIESSVDDTLNVNSHIDDEEEDDEDNNLETNEEHTDDESESSDNGEEQGESTELSERESIAARRREERRRKKEAAKEREATLRRELAARDTVINELRARQDAFERRNVGNDLAQLENTKRQLVQAYSYFKDQIRVATEAGNGTAVADATEKMLQAQRKFDEVTQYENAFKRQQAAPQPLDPRLASHAQKWMSQNKWYDTTGKDPDSRIALTLDQQLSEEGWDPTTEDYWKELNARVKKYLPHRVGSSKISSQSKPRSTVAGSGRESSGTQKGTYRLSPERVNALKEAGLWDDPTKRADAIKRFREYDKQNQG